MKKSAAIFFMFLILLINTILLFPSPAVLVLASQNGYAKILDDNVMLYKNRTLLNEDALFYIPKSYYVEIIQVYETYYAVTYGSFDGGFTKIDGFIKRTDNLRLVDSVEITPLYLNLKITPSQRAKLYAKPDSTLPPMAEISGLDTVYYLGSISANGSTYYLILTDLYLGYAESLCFSTFTVPLHQLPIAIIQELPEEELPPNQGDEPAEPTDNSQRVKVLLIIGITIPALIIIYIIFKRK